ncbi:MAG: hypothetical protein E6J90_28285 [Deltaproteobacteria bacterium]|nr:MAG: hypothetical protein E6J90_28285 [Deltaproteobacteria bacterium]
MKTTKPTNTTRASAPALAPSAWTPAGPTGAPRGAFAAVAALAGPLGRADQRLLEAALLDGHRCSELARALGVEAAEVRRRLGAAMLALHAALIGEPAHGPVASLLALRALDALDPDEAALVDAILAHDPALQRIHAGYCELVGELCLLVARVAPPPCPMPPDDAVDAAVN